MPKLTEDDIKSVTHLTAKEAAKRLCVSEPTIHRCRKKYDICPGRIGRWTRKLPRIIKICEYCNNDYKVIETDETRFCSHSCYTDYRVDHPEEYEYSKYHKETLSRKAIERWENPSQNILDGIEKRKKDDLNPYHKYRYRVYRLSEETYTKYEDEINPLGYIRTLAGVEDGYHLDHIIPCRYGFDNNIPPEELAKKENLQMLPWKENITKGCKL